MSLFIDESIIKIEFSENDYIEIKKELPYKSVFLVAETKEDKGKIYDVLLSSLVKMVSDGVDVEINKQNIEKLGMKVVNKIFAKITEQIAEDTEIVKKN